MTNQSENYKVMKEIFNSIDGVNLSERKGNTFYYTFHLTKQMEEAGVEELDLHVRAYNGLKRAGIDTIGQLAQAIAGGTDIRRIRQCGAKSYSEIMEKLFLYNLIHLPSDKRAVFIMETVDKNRHFPDDL